jgi:hypothetical protein
VLRKRSVAHMVSSVVEEVGLLKGPKLISRETGGNICVGEGRESRESRGYVEYWKWVRW